jgi:hypothetical protein
VRQGWQRIRETAVDVPMFVTHSNTAHTFRFHVSDFASTHPRDMHILSLSTHTHLISGLLLPYTLADAPTRDLAIPDPKHSAPQPSFISQDHHIARYNAND